MTSLSLSLAPIPLAPIPLAITRPDRFLRDSSLLAGSP